MTVAPSMGLPCDVILPAIVEVGTSSSAAAEPAENSNMKTTPAAMDFNAKHELAEAFFKGDMDGNLRTNLKDFNLFRELFSLPAGAAASAVPEPGTSLLMGIALGFLLTWRRRRAAQ